MNAHVSISKQGRYGSTTIGENEPSTSRPRSSAALGVILTAGSGSIAVTVETWDDHPKAIDEEGEPVRVGLVSSRTTIDLSRAELRALARHILAATEESDLP